MTRVCLPSQSAPETHNQEKKAHKPLRTLCISQKMCRPCLIIIKCDYFDYRINKLFTLSSCLVCVSCSVHLISAYHVRKGSWPFLSQLPTNQQGQKIQSRHRRFEWSFLPGCYFPIYFVSHFGLFRYGRFCIRFLVFSPTCFAPLSHVVNKLLCSSRLGSQCSSQVTVRRSRRSRISFVGL